MGEGPAALLPHIMYDLNPDAVGGAMPGDDFYYIPANN